MDNDKLNKIQNLLEDEEFKVDGFEFKLWNIRSSWADSLFFDFKVHNPNDESFCRQCLENSLWVMVFTVGAVFAVVFASLAVVSRPPYCVMAGFTVKMAMATIAPMDFQCFTNMVPI